MEDQGNMFSLESISEYRMNLQEAKTFKVCLIWMKLCEKILPSYPYSKLIKNSDPRKSNLFRMCWKFLKETKGIIPDEQIPNFIRAQIEMLKCFKYDNGAHVLIEPNCLVGEKSWIRWKMWSKKLEKTIRDKNQERGEENRTPLFKIANELDKTKTFFSRFYENGPNISEVKEMISNHNLRRWVLLGKVSPYYILLSPLIRSSFQDLKIGEYFSGIDFGLYLPDITNEVRDLFREKFTSEFKSH